jgi:asparagine synthase (glutamine-hydrolysing)
MAGIFGIWNFDGRPLDRAVIEKMGRRLAHRGPDGESIFSTTTAAIGCRIFRVTPESSSDVQPCVRRDGAVIVFDGRLDNRGDLISRLRDHHDVSDRTPDPELVAACYETAGQDFAARLEGDFAAAVLDLPSRRLLLARDAIGVRPLYYWTDAGTLMFASEIKAILAHAGVRARVDETVLAEYFVSRLHRQPEDGGTFFKDIHTVPPSHVVTATPERVNARRYWDFTTQSQDGPRSFDQAAEGFRHHFLQSVRRRVRSARPVAVSVSGGLDSSSIFCAALAMHGAHPKDIPGIIGLTYTPTDGSPADEHEFVEELERFTGIAIARVPLARGIRDDLDASIWHAESPAPDCQWNTTRRLFMATADRGARVILTGHWGDQMLFDQAYLVDLVRAGAWGQVAAHLRAYVEWHPDDSTAREFWRFFLSDLTRHALPASLSRSVRRVRRRLSKEPVASAWFRDSFIRQAPRREFRHREPPGTAHARSLYREARSRYNVQCLEWQNKIGAMYRLEPALPFLDRELIQFLMSVPGAVLTRDGVPKAILRQALTGVVPEPILARKSKADFTAVTNEGIRQDCGAATLAPASFPSGIARGFIDERALATALAEAQDALDGVAVTSGRNIAGLVGLELWLAAFFEGDRPDEGRS